MNKKTVGLFIQKHPQAFDSLLIVSLAVAFLLIWSLLADPWHLHLSTPMLTDQISYITTGRSLVDSGKLNGNLIYIDMLQQVYTKNTFYMPGYPAILALSFWLFGYGAFQAVLPSLAAYVGGAWLVYLVGAAIFDRKSGWIAAFLFLAFPTNLFFSFTAMTEMTLVFSSLLAFYIFIRLKPNLRWLLGPFLVGLVFLIRESSAFLVLLFAFFMLLQGWRKYWKDTLLFCMGSLGILILIYYSPLATGRMPSTIFFQVIRNDINPQLGPSSIGQLFQFILNVGLENWHGMGFPLAKDILMIGAVFGISLLTLLYGLAKKQFLYYYLPVFSLVLLTTGIIFWIYTLGDFRGLRILMFTISFPLIGLGSVLAQSSDLFTKRLKPIPWVVIALFMLSCLQQTRDLFSVLMPPGQTAYEQQTVQLIEAVGHDDRQVLVAPLNFAVTYVDEHYPVKLAFVPASQAAFELLDEKYSIGTLIYQVSDAEPEPGYLARMREYGFTPGEQIRFDGSTYLVFTR